MNELLDLLAHVVARGAAVDVGLVAASLAAAPGRAPTQATILDVLTKAGFADVVASALCRASAAVAIGANCEVSPIVVLLVALASVVRGGDGGAPLDGIDDTASRLALAQALVAQHFGGGEAAQLAAFLAAYAAPPLVVQGAAKQSCVVGEAECVADAPGTALLVEDCEAATVFVTAAVGRLTVRRCRSCTIAAVPSGVSVVVEDCAGCTFTVAAPLVSVKGSTGCTFFVWSHAPVLVGSGSSDIAIGPYNAVGDGVTDGASFKRWYVRGDSRFDGGGAGHGACRAVLPSEFCWRFLPLPQLKNEHIVMPLAFTLATAAPPVPADAAALKGLPAQRAEIKVQAAFVVSGPSHRVVCSRLKADRRLGQGHSLHGRVA